LGDHVDDVEQLRELGRPSVEGADFRAKPSADVLFLRSMVMKRDRTSVAGRMKARTTASIEAVGSGLCLTEADLSDIDLSRLDLRRANLTRAHLASTNLRGADLSDAALICPLMERTVLRGNYSGVGLMGTCDRGA
jgi:uncharacterized protein YjbI with pentapeptide repeats